MQKYFELLRTIKEKGTWKNASRPNLPKTLSLFGHQYRCNLQDGFPILTTKKVSLKNISTELIWFLRGSEPLNIKYLVDNGCNIWNQDAYRWYINCVEDSHFTLEQFVYEIKSSNVNSLSRFNKRYKLGDCPLGYELWRNFNGVDQISELISGLKKYPEDRGHQITALNPAYRDVALRPCHVYAQFNCREMTFIERAKLYFSQSNEDEVEEEYLDSICIPKYYLDCQLYQRSCDVFLGVPYNTASYALLTHIIAEICGFAVGDFVHTFGDVHIYENHLSAVDEQLLRTSSELPKLKFEQRFTTELFIYNELNDFNQFINAISYKDFSLIGYNPQPSIHADLKTGL